MPKTPIPVLSDEEIKATATFVVKRFRKFKQQPCEDAAKHRIALPQANITRPPLLQASAKSPGMPVPPHCNPDQQPRLSQPQIQVKGNATGKGKDIVRTPAYPKGGLSPPSSSSKGHYVRPPLGGTPCPAAKPTPRSLAFRSPTSRSPFTWEYKEALAEPNPPPRYMHELALPRTAQVESPTTSQLQGQACVLKCVQRFTQCLQTLGDTSALRHVLQQSSAPQDHVARVLGRYSPSTLEKYLLSCVAVFLDFRQSDMALTQGELTVQRIADYMLCSQRSAVQDLKALR